MTPPGSSREDDPPPSSAWATAEEEGEEIGRIKDVLTMPSSDVYVIEGARSYMIPAVKEFVREIDTAAGVVRVHLIEGMATDEN